MKTRERMRRNSWKISAEKIPVNTLCFDAVVQCHSGGHFKQIPSEVTITLLQTGLPVIYLPDPRRSCNEIFRTGFHQRARFQLRKTQGACVLQQW